MTDPDIEYPEIVYKKKWISARRKLLKKEKEFTKARDTLNAERRRLPMVKIDKDYEFHGPEGNVHLLDLFEDRLQLIIYHFMFDPDWDQGCTSCSAWADQIARGHLNHLNSRSTTLALVSRAPFHKLQAFKKRMGWTTPWYSSFNNKFNYDFHVTQDESVAPVQYNYRDKTTLEHLGQYYHTKGEQPGISCFLRDGDDIFHTYSTYGRGMEAAGDANHFLDLTALGRQEEWEKPEERVTGLGAIAGSKKILYPDQYNQD